jgi:uncharacterized protein YjbI with pentapeptide repeats
VTQPQNPQAPQPSPPPHSGSSPTAPSASQANTNQSTALNTGAGKGTKRFLENYWEFVTQIGQVLMRGLWRPVYLSIHDAIALYLLCLILDSIGKWIFGKSFSDFGICLQENALSPTQSACFIIFTSDLFPWIVFSGRTMGRSWADFSSLWKRKGVAGREAPGMVHHKKFTLEQEAKTGFSSLLKQSFSVFVGLLLMLLLTGGNPPGFVVDLSFSLGVAFVAWSEKQRLTNQQTPNISGGGLSRVGLNYNNLPPFRLRRSKLILNTMKVNRHDQNSASLIRINLNDYNLSSVNLDGLDLSSADLIGTNLNGASLRCANLNGASLRGATLIGTNLSGATLRCASLSSANLIGAILVDTTLFSADLSRANLTLANLTHSNFLGAILTGATLPRANLSSVTLTCADLVGANLSDANLSDASLRSANLRSADLTGADLTGADLSRANLPHANLSSANLIATNLSGAFVEKAQFGDNLGLTEEIELDLKQRGAIFKDSSGV